MKLTKCFCLNENIRFRGCVKCKSELSAFCVTTEELNTIDIKYLEMLISSKLLKLNGVAIDKHIIFVCKNCSDLKKDK